ncbi:MAG: DUF5074 domain-containing protein [Bacteroidota bacterium]
MIKNKITSLLLGLFAISLLTACGDDEPEAILNTSVFVVNEGNFRAADGSLSTYNIETEQVTQNVYETSGTTQSVTEYAGELYVVTNATDKLDILNKEAVTLRATVGDGLVTPISFAAVGNRGFVSCWGEFDDNFNNPDSYLAVIDLTTNTVTSTIAMGARTQYVVSQNNKIYAAVVGSNVVKVVDPSSLAVRDITVSDGPSTMVVDAGGDIWVLCTSGSLVQIDTETDEVTGRSLTGLTTAGFNEKVTIDRSRNLLYFLGGGNETFTGQTNVFRVDLSAATLAAEAFITDGFAFYGVAVNQDNGEIYVGDSNAFQSTGTGFRYSAEGTLLADFATGIGPNNFLFTQ